MNTNRSFGMILAGAATGVINGIFGAGGGMILIPMLNSLTDLEEEEIFPASISIVLPICLVSLAVTAIKEPLPFSSALPYLIGSGTGGILAGIFGKRIPTLWLHRLLGVLILWGGVRYLC